MTRPRPFVYANMAMTADGKITSAGRDYPRFTSPFDRRMMGRLRAEADAIIVGAGTLRADDPPMAIRNPELQSYRQRLGRADPPVEIVVSRTLSFDQKSSFFTDEAPRIIATIDDAPRDRIEELSQLATVWTLGQGQVNIPTLLERLTGRGIERLLLEGGAELNWAFLEADCLDELYMTIAPTLLGGRHAPTPFGGDGLPMSERRPLELLSMHREGDELYLRYRVVR